jgi:uncharacterized protein YraI
MSLSTLARTSLVAGMLIIAGMPMPASAQETRVIVPDTSTSVATTTVNVRRGPGTNYAVVDVLRQGQSVTNLGCDRNNWCEVRTNSNRGWVSGQFLRPAGGGGGGNVVRPGFPDININIGSGGVSVDLGDRRACFYDRANMRGQSFCARAGESNRNLGAWNNRIVSLRTSGRNTRVEVCTERNFRNCSTFTGDVPVLNFMLQGNISSFRVR